MRNQIKVLTNNLEGVPGLPFIPLIWRHFVPRKELGTISSSKLLGSEERVSIGA